MENGKYFFTKKTITYTIIFIFIILSLMQLYKIKENVTESFITLTEPQIFGDNANAVIRSTDDVTFGTVGTSAAPNSLSKLLNSKLGVDGSNNLTVPGTITAGNGLVAKSWLACDISSNEGGNITLRNPSKTSDKNTADNWTLFNMKDGPPNAYGNGLHFYKYNNSGFTGSKDPRHCTMYDNGSTVFRGNLEVQGDLSVGSRANVKDSDNVLRWNTNDGTGTFIVRCNTVEPSLGCLRIETSDWGSITKTYSTLNCKGRLHLYSDESILLVTKGVTVIHKRDDLAATGNLEVQGNLSVASGINVISGEIKTNNGGLVSVSATNVGAYIGLINPTKANIAGLANEWRIYNMTDKGPATDKYANGLHFWKYGKDLASDGDHFILYDNGNSEFRGPLIVSRPLKNSSDGAAWHTNNGQGTFVIACHDVPAADGCLRIQTTQWDTAGSTSPTFSTIHAKGRLHINSTENIYLLGNVVQVHKNTAAGWSGNLMVDNDLWAKGIYLGSDRRLKENIKTISQTDKDKVLQLVPKTYTLIADEKKTKTYGLIAQEVEELYPELVTTNSTDGMKSLNYVELIPLLLEQIKELKKSIPNPNVINIGGVTLTANELLKLKQLIH
jgi:hypothetical protein